MRLVDYIIGRINGKYLPSDPSLYRRKNRTTSIYGPPRHESQFGSQGNVDQMVKPIMQGIKEGKMAFKNNVVDTALHYQSFNSGSQQRYDMPDESSVSDHVIQTTIKMANLKKVLSESYPPNEAQKILSTIWACCLGKGDYSLLDKMLKGYGDIAKLRQALD